MKIFFKKYREIITLLAWLVLLLVIIRFAIIPLLSRIEGISDQIQEENLKQEIDAKNINDLPKFEQQYNILESDAQMADVLLDKSNAVELIKLLEKTADDTAVKITIAVKEQQVAAAKPQNINSNKNKISTENSITDDLPSANYLQLKITLEGKYGQIIKYVNALENLEYYNDIIGIDIKKKDLKNASSRQSTNGIGNPFEASREKAVSSDNVIEDALVADFDVVFYTK